tara:strand:+ start:9775 stop:11310 length:1536 start_codon:yes stop_codon:yes gene_type:complete
MPKIKNMGTSRMRFNEGIIVSGSEEGGVALAVAHDISSEYVVTIDNDQGNQGHVLKLFTDGNGSNTRVLEMEDGDGDTIFRARADGRFGFGPDGVSSMGAGTFVVGIDNSAHTSDIAISRRLQHLGDANTYLDFPVGDQMQFQVGGVDMIHMTENNSQDTIVFNGGEADVDFIVKSNNNNSMFFVDGGNNKVGIGINTPGTVLHVDGGTDASRSTANSGHLILGPTNGTNMVLDGNEIIARNNGQPNTLYLNHQSGGVHIGDYNGVVMGSETFRVSGDTIISGSLTVNLGGSGEVVKIAGELDENVSLVFEQPMGTNRASIGLDGGDNMDIANYSAWDDINIMTTSGAGTLTGLVITAQQRVGVGNFGWEGKGPVGDPATGYGYNAPFPSCELDVSGSMKVSESATFKGSVYKNTTVVNSSPYTVQPSDYILLVNTSATRVINLPAKANELGRILIIKDASGNAGNQTITISPNGTEQIDGDDQKNITNNYKGLTILCGPDQWHRISEYDM